MYSIIAGLWIMVGLLTAGSKLSFEDLASGDSILAIAILVLTFLVAILVCNVAALHNRVWSSIVLFFVIIGLSTLSFHEEELKHLFDPNWWFGK